MAALPGLVLVEGLCGSGKSTLTQGLGERLPGRGLRVRSYQEGDWPHPGSLNGHACFAPEAYARLLEMHPGQAAHIRARALDAAPYVLVPYRDDPVFSGEEALLSTLQAHELCYTQVAQVPVDDFSALLAGRWVELACQQADAPQVLVMEAVFMQHAIHDFWKLYDAADARIERHLLAVSRAIAPLAPVLLYLSQPDVPRQMRWIAGVREKPKYASEERIDFMRRRKRLETELLAVLPFPAHVLEHDGDAWEALSCRAEDIVSEHLTENQLHN